MESCCKNLSLDDGNKEESFTFNGGAGSIHCVKWYMKYFICWTADLKLSKLWLSQLRTQFKQLRIAWKSRISSGFEPVTSEYRVDALTNWAIKRLTLGAGHLWVPMSSSTYEIFHISLHIHSSQAHWNSQMTSSQRQWLHSSVH